MVRVLKDVAAKASSFFFAHRPEVLIGIGVIGFIVTIVTLIKSIPKYKKVKEDWQKNPPKNQREKVWAFKDMLKPFIPVAVAFIGTIACVLLGAYFGYHRAAELASALTVSNETIRLYEKKMVEKLGEGKARSIKDAVAEERVEHERIAPMSSDNVAVPNGGKVFETGMPGSQLCWDPIREQWISIPKIAIQNADIRIRERLRDEMDLTLNDVYDELELPHYHYVGDIMGWDVDKTDIKSHVLDVSWSNPKWSDAPVMILNFQPFNKFSYV